MKTFATALLGIALLSGLALQAQSPAAPGAKRDAAACQGRRGEGRGQGCRREGAGQGCRQDGTGRRGGTAECPRTPAAPTK